MFWSAVLSVCFYISMVVSQQCPEYSTYAECGCMLTCENPYPSDDCSEKCEPGCYCDPEYLLRSDGQCVLQSQCANPGQYPPNAQDNSYQQCEEDEEYYDCTPSCKNTCENINNQEARCNCAPPGCFCKEGLVKRADGKCVPPQECQVAPSDCPPNAIYIPCGSACAPTCEDPRLQSCGDKCVAACFCKPGYLLSKDGKGCVPPQHCNLKDIPVPPEPKCPEYSVYIQCGSACAPTCKNMHPEPCGDECVSACFCIPGYLMNNNGTRCVRPDQCEVAPPPPPTPVEYPTKCPENAVYKDCGTSCPKTCEDSYPSPCTLECVAGCFCKPGFVKRKDGKCVTKEQCENRCGPDEQYYECTPSCKNTCKNYNNPAAKCGCGPPGCFCREGLVKREDGKCVRKNQCPITPPKCVENAMFVPCGSSCPPTCDNPRPHPCSQRCVAGCFCKHGFLQTKDGKCVLPQQCEKNVTRCPENAEYSECGPSCPEDCENTQPRQPCVAACFKGCVCKPGFVLSTKERNCIPTSMCDKKCPLPEEEYLECGPTCPDTCDNIGVVRPGGCPKKCVRGCFCRKGLFRDLKGACVPLKDCPTRVTPFPSTGTTRTSPAYGVTFGESRGCPNQKLCEDFCKSHKLRYGYCVGDDKRECHCS